MGSAITCPELTSSWNNNSVRAATATLRLQGLPISRGAFLITNVSSRCREMPLTDTGLPTADPRWIFPLTEWWNGRDDVPDVPCPDPKLFPHSCDDSLSVDNQQVGILTVLITHRRHNSVMYPADTKVQQMWLLITERRKGKGRVFSSAYKFIMGG